MKIIKTQNKKYFDLEFWSQHAKIINKKRHFSNFGEQEIIDKYVRLFDLENKSKTIVDIGVRVGLDKARLLRDMERPEIEAQLRKNFELAEALKLNGTPSFVIGDNVVRGARDLQTLKNLVAEARTKAK